MMFLMCYRSDLSSGSVRRPMFFKMTFSRARNCSYSFSASASSSSSCFSGITGSWWTSNHTRNQTQKTKGMFDYSVWYEPKLHEASWVQEQSKSDKQNLTQYFCLIFHINWKLHKNKSCFLKKYIKIECLKPDICQ